MWSFGKLFGRNSNAGNGAGQELPADTGETEVIHTGRFEPGAFTAGPVETGPVAPTHPAGAQAAEARAAKADHPAQGDNRAAEEAVAEQPVLKTAGSQKPLSGTAAEAATAQAPHAEKSASMPAPTPKFDVLHASWREAIARLGGVNPLLHFEDKERNRIDLSTTHPSGLAQFITGQKTLLSQLIRDDVALRKAKRAAANVAAKALEMRNVRGLETVHLGVGIAKWVFEGENFAAPVLLRPLAIRRYGRDFEIKLKGTATVNPELIRVLYQQFGIAIDARTLLALSQSEGVFKPQPVIDRLRMMAAGVAGFTVEPRLVASSFSGISHRMVQDLKDLDTPVLRAVAGDQAAIEQLRRAYKPVNPTPLNSRTPENDRLLYDADSQQDDVISQIAAGHSLTVHTLPGTGGTQTVVNAIGELVRAGKRVLVVSPRHATIEGISHRLNRVGLGGLAVTPRRLRRSLVEAIRRNEVSNQQPAVDVDQALVRLRNLLIDYRDALDTEDKQLNVTPLTALRELAKLSMLPNAPQTTVRLSQSALQSLALDRSAVADALIEAARLGQFDYGPADSPWYGVSFNSTEEARSAYSRAVDLAETKLPRLHSVAGEMVVQTSLRPYESITELGIYIRLFEGIRETLDRFVPEVYERSLSEVIAAHAPRSANDTMSAANRRRLKKLAREYVRPGVTVNDMFERLKAIQQQRVLWHRYCTIPGARQEVPLGLAEVAANFERVYDDLEKLDAVLGVASDDQRLRNLSVSALAHRISALAQESEVLKNIQERTAIMEQLRDADLGQLLDDLSARHVPADEVAAELEQAWWQTALETMLHNNPALLSANTGVVERLESDFRLVDDAHAGANGAILASQLADIWRVGVIDHRNEAKALREALRAGGASPTALLETAPTLMSILAPVWAMSPYEVSLLPSQMRFDTLLIVDAAGISLVEAVGAIRRAKQVVAFGDPVIQQPSSFEVGVRETDSVAAGAQPLTESVYSALRKVLPELQLTRSYRAGGADLTKLVNEKFYEGQIESMPWAGSFLGRSSLVHEYVRGGQGLPDPESGAVESTDAEVERVVILVLKHAEERPNESLMVVTASAKHAVRVWQSVLSAFAKRPELRDFLLGEHAEPFTVVTIEQSSALSRDRVIFSIGYGRTPHGRVLSDFGPLSQPGGERLIAVAMTRARRAMTVVSCFRAQHLESINPRYGVHQLAAVLGAEPAPEIEATLPAEPDSMVAELAERLHRLGLKVALNYQGVIPIAAALGDRAIAIDIDFSGEDESMRHTLRLRPALLRRLGWHYQRVQSFDLFSDPQEVAERVAGIIGWDRETAAARERLAEQETVAYTETEIVNVVENDTATIFEERAAGAAAVAEFATTVAETETEVSDSATETAQGAEDGSEDQHSAGAVEAAAAAEDSSETEESATDD
ncbi:DEAD/DEAH box helicase [Canibacter zhoujuaniae]|uniref:DEAD/DEAH box helicase n=1 Tax=Canibacter zhoujuaniae TaxID=2708343 RepID=UPI001AB02572|nr:AAA family ATPase [Canibacter zhoujuaniae]